MDVLPSEGTRLQKSKIIPLNSLSLENMYLERFYNSEKREVPLGSALMRASR